MKQPGRIPILLLLCLLLAASASRAQTESIEERVDGLVKVQHLDGIPYSDAKALGREAIPHLVSLLGDPKQKEFWVNVIVTLGFIEDSAALAPLEAFLDSAQGEVDVLTFRALLSVPYAIGCIAGNGDPSAYNFLLSSARGTSPGPRRWRFGAQDVDQLMTERGILGLGVSGLPAAKAELQRMKQEIRQAPATTAPAKARSPLDAIDSGLGLMERMSTHGKAAVFNPVR